MALILHLDDEPWLLKPVAAYLKQNGHHVLSLEDSYEALHLLRTQSIDLLIQDINRPKMNGREVYNLMKADPKLKHIPVLITSGNQGSWPSVADEVNKSNDIFIPKPFSLKEFNDALSQLLSRLKAD